MRSMHLFAGVGGGLLGDLILGHKPVVAVEWNKKRCSVLEARKRAGWFPDLEVQCVDIRAFDGSRWAGKVDVLHAGIPCPRWSTARRGAGNPDDYWPEVVRILEQVRPWVLFIESVKGIAREHQRFENDLWERGYTLKPGIITDASSLGAPHSRERYWAIAYAHENGEPSFAQYDETPLLSSIEGCGWWETDPRFLGVDDGMADRVERFRLEAIGDGQVPLQMAVAFVLLCKKPA